MLSSNVDRNDFIEAVREMDRTKAPGCYYWTLWMDDEDVHALVLGWDPDDDGGYELSAKLAFQPRNSIMQCDFDVDWPMPYDDETGDVDDTRLPVSPENAGQVFDWLTGEAQHRLASW